MIIDLILDRKQGTNYKPRTFCNGIIGYGEISWDIADAMDSGSEYDVKCALRPLYYR